MGEQNFCRLDKGSRVASTRGVSIPPKVRINPANGRGHEFNSHNVHHSARHPPCRGGWGRRFDPRDVRSVLCVLTLRRNVSRKGFERVDSWRTRLIDLFYENPQKYQMMQVG